MTKQKLAVELIRVSSAQQAGTDLAGLQPQREANALTARVNNLKIVKRFEIVDVSGANTFKCPQMVELLEWIARPEIEGIVCVMFSRLLRAQNNSDLARLLDTLRDENVIIYLPDGPLDLSTEDGMLVGTLRGALSGMEIRSNIKNMWRGKETVRLAGGHAGNWKNLPFGVGYIEGHGWKFEPESLRVKQAFEMFSRGDASYAEVAKRTGLNPMTLRNLLSNPTYTGWRVYSKRVDPSPKARRYHEDGTQKSKLKIARPPDQIIRKRMQYDGIEIEPLVSQSLFDRVQEIMARKVKDHWRMVGTPHKELYTYAGFAFCAKCGKRLYGEGFPRRYYICKQKRNGKCDAIHQRQDVLESLLDEVIGNYLSNPKRLAEIAEAYIEQQQSGRGELSRPRLEADIKALRSKRERVLDNYENGHTTSAERDAKLSVISRDLAAAEQALMNTGAIEQVTPARLMAIFKPLCKWARMDREKRRQTLAVIGVEILCSGYKVEGVRIAGVIEALGTPHSARGLERVGSSGPGHMATDAYTAITLPFPKMPGAVIEAAKGRRTDGTYGSTYS